ncbi:MAG: DEAD/DEAH box helicase, partial [Phycisphaerales bacterium]|nr:DEAD/DEAH box helicase [Phycisphaerales bacterium]
PRALVLCPTRELATQIYESFVAYGRFVKLRHCVIFGGVSQSKQERHLANAPDVIVATPGRLLDLINQGFIRLDMIETLVLDEADRMLDMGFINDLRKIVKMTPDARQTMLFSATMPPTIRTLADRILRDPEFIQVDPVASTAKAIHQSVHRVEKGNKPQLLTELLSAPEVERTLVFTRTKHGADKVVKGLRRFGIHADAIHGNKSQNARTRALDAFRSGRTAVLVATDIAARGIDVDGITHVFNFDIPADAETYVHRIGRTARAGASGVAISFCSEEESAHLRAIERLIGSKLEVNRHEPQQAQRQPRPVPERNVESADNTPQLGTHPKKKKRRRVHRSEIGLSAHAPGNSSRKPRTRSSRSR